MIYQFEELEESVQEKIIEKVRHPDSYLDRLWWSSWWEEVYDAFVEHAAQYGVLVDRERISFDLDSNHADFSGGITDIKTFAEARSLNIPENILSFLSSSDCSWEIGDEYIAVPDESDEVSEADVEKYSRLIMDETGLLDEKLCSDLLRALQLEFDYRNSDECISEYLMANGTEYMEDGTKWTH